MTSEFLLRLTEYLADWGENHHINRDGDCNDLLNFIEYCVKREFERQKEIKQ